MPKLLSTKLPPGKFIAIMAICLAMAGAAFTVVQAANLVNPTAPPPGGQTAEPLNASAVEQHKLGSLIIGTQSATCDFGLGGNQNSCAQLCLNAGSIGNAQKCIKQWGDISGVLNSTLVVLHSESVTSGANAIQQSGQSGYARLKGNNVANYPVTSRFRVPDCGGGGCAGTYTALYANGLTLDNNAGYFAGSLGIGPTVNGSDGRLCLNGTADSAADGHYCIYHWSDITTTVTNKLTLQPLTATATAETGHVALGQAFNSASVVIGDPTGLGLAYTCGDGMCNAGENSTSGDPKYCPIDCAAIKSMVAVTATQVGADVSLNLSTGASQEPLGSLVTVLVVRATVANSAFRPTNGVTYARGGTTSFEIVGSRTCSAGVSSGCTLTDTSVDGNNSLVAGTTYYYSAFQGNLYPRYQTAAPATANITIQSTGGNNGGDINPPEDPPPVIP